MRMDAVPLRGAPLAAGVASIKLGLPGAGFAIGGSRLVMSIEWGALKGAHPVQC